MRLYTTLFRISLQDATQYRVESAIWFLYEVVANILGGMLIPIALLPEWLQDVSRMLPVQAIYSVPLAVLLGKSDGPTAWLGILLQLGWIAMLWGLAIVLWRAGLRQYEAVGR